MNDLLQSQWEAAWRRAGKAKPAAMPWFLALLLSGCSTSPAQNILGSFFPAWMLCAVIGVVVAVVVRKILVIAGINDFVVAPPLTYVLLAVAVTLLVWLLQFGG